MSISQIPATRQELLLIKKRLKHTKKGKALLEDKRDSLIQLFLAVISEAISLRKKIDQRQKDIARNFELATRIIDPEYIQAVANTTLESIHIDTSYTHKMGVQLPKVEVSIKKSSTSYSQILTNQRLDRSINEFRQLLPLITKLIEKEHVAVLLAQEIQTTRRRVNSLKHKVIPSLKTDQKTIAQKLEEHNRSAISALMQFKSTASDTI